MMSASVKNYWQESHWRFTLVILTTLTLGSLLSGCGYHLRGSSSAAPMNISSVYIEALNASLVVAELKTQLGYRDIAIKSDSAGVDRIVQLKNEQLNRRVLSVDETTGKVTEFELEYRVGLIVLASDGRILAEPQDLSLIRDVSFDSTLGKLDEEAIVRNEMIQNAANTILFRLQTSGK